MVDPVVVELASADAAVAAAERLRALGYTRLAAYTPFPVAALETTLHIPRTKLPWLVLAAGTSGAALSYAILAWTNATDYRLDVGGRPYNSLPSHVPIVFETTVLLAALTAFAAALLLSGLPRLHHRVFDIEGFERTTLDRFWIVVGDPSSSPGEDAPAPEEELRVLRAELLPLGALVVRSARQVLP
jgi:hypothetical protein